jgi:hypothetical protein
MMTFHSYRLVSDATVLLVGLAVLTYCCLSPRRRPYVPGFALISAAAAGELVREAVWPTRGTATDLWFSIVDLTMVTLGLLLIVSRWRREKYS